MSNENIQPNRPNEISNKPTQLSISEVTVFKDSPHLAYLYKKTEKLVSALYLLSSFISDKEPIKWQMREAGLNLLSQSLSLSDSLSFVSTGLKFLSFLEVSHISGIISDMNYNILKYEFENLIKKAELGERGNNAKGLVFPEHFFEVSHGQNDGQIMPEKNIALARPINTTPSKPKGQNNVSDKLSLKTNRQDIIIGLLKKNPELGIKDFTLAIKDCSEKTIQRELATLVSKGQIKKDGEKRWSRYSLKQA